MCSPGGLYCPRADRDAQRACPGSLGYQRRGCTSSVSTAIEPVVAGSCCACVSVERVLRGVVERAAADQALQIVAAVLSVIVEDVAHSVSAPAQATSSTAEASDAQQASGSAPWTGLRLASWRDTTPAKRCRRQAIGYAGLEGSPSRADEEPRRARRLSPSRSLAQFPCSSCRPIHRCLSKPVAGGRAGISFKRGVGGCPDPLRRAPGRRWIRGCRCARRAARSHRLGLASQQLPRREAWVV